MAERKLPTADDYPNNSDHRVERRKDEDRKQLPAPDMRGGVRARKSGLRKIKDEFISEDAPSVGSYILYDVMIPALRDLLLDILHGSIDVAFGSGGGSGYRRSPSRGRNDRSYISYDRMYDGRRSSNDRRAERRLHDRIDDDFEFDYKEDADDVLDWLCDIIDDEGKVSVATLYDICKMTVPHDFVKEDWGWTNLSAAKVKPWRGKYYIEFPRIRPI